MRRHPRRRSHRRAPVQLQWTWPAVLPHSPPRRHRRARKNGGDPGRRLLRHGRNRPCRREQLPPRLHGQRRSVLQKRLRRRAYHETPLALIRRCAGHRDGRCGDRTGVSLPRPAAQRKGSEGRAGQSAQFARKRLLPGRRAERRRAQHRRDPRHRCKHRIPGDRQASQGDRRRLGRSHRRVLPVREAEQHRRRHLDRTGLHERIQHPRQRERLAASWLSARRRTPLIQTLSPLLLLVLIWSPACAEAQTVASPPGDEPRVRARSLGLDLGTYPTGKLNAITDVPGVRVGHTTLIRGDGKLVPGQGPVRTGVTVVIPREDVWHKKAPAGAFVLNGTGEMTGLAWVEESGFLEYPIALTNTLNLPRVANGVMSWMISRYPEIGIRDDKASAPGPDGSIIIIIATDAPLDARQLKRLAKRAALGLARTGSTVRHGSGDFILAFSTGNVIPHYPKERTYPMTVFADTHLNPLFAATVEATQEAILNALTMATTVIGRDGHKAEALNLTRVREILKQFRK